VLDEADAAAETEVDEPEATAAPEEPGPSEEPEPAELRENE